MQIATHIFYPNRSPRLRLFALWYFSILITLWIIVGHMVLGFEQSYAHPVVGVLTCYATQTLLEWAHAAGIRRKPRYSGGARAWLEFLLPAHIPGVACAMLLYPNENLGPIAFASALSIASKVLFRAPVAVGVTQHIFNPSNFGITLTLLLMPWVGIAPPYHFTENVSGAAAWLIPAAILCSGMFIHGVATGRLPLVAGWLVGFLLQALVRSLVAGTSLIAPLAPMTSAAFILFTLYMIPDPATTPIARSRQVVFGVSVAAVYGALIAMHLVYGLFLSLFIVCAVRGAALLLMSRLRPVPAV